MDHPKFTLEFDHKHPGAPFMIREYVVQAGPTGEPQVMQCPHSSYKHYTDALESLSKLSSSGIIMLAASVEKADGTATI